MYAEPFKRNALYIFNPSGNEIVVTVLSFSAEFDPLTLALSEISLDLPTADLGLSTVVSSFESPLPAGSNTIGKVDIANFPSEYVAMITNIEAALKKVKVDNSDVITAINNKTFNADISGDVYATVDNSDVVAAIDDLKTIIGGEGDRIVSSVNGISLDNSDVVAAINGISLDNSDVVSAINGIELDNSDVVSAVNNSAKPKIITSIGAETTISGYEYVKPTAGSGKKITCIDFIANDGEHNVTLEYTGVSLTIKPNEVINNVRCYVDNITIADDTGNAAKVRYLLTVEGV